MNNQKTVIVNIKKEIEEELLFKGQIKIITEKEKEVSPLWEGGNFLLALGIFLFIGLMSLLLVY